MRGAGPYSKLGPSPRHFFDSQELRTLLQGTGLRGVELGSAPAMSAALQGRLELAEQNPTAWRLIRELEDRAYRLPGPLDGGEVLLGLGRVPTNDNCI